MYISLARKYRPKTFGDVAVQSHVANTLMGAIARGRVAHGYLLCGPRGVGKTTLARVLAMALNCERREAELPGSGKREEGSGNDLGGEMAARGSLPGSSGEPCGECASCMRIWSGAASLDVVEIDAASNRGVDDARELRERAMYAPSAEGHYKVYIVDEAHMLTREAWNALLKILEEPPPRVVFVFATTEPQRIAQMAAPVLSRLQRFDFKRIGPADVRARLATVLTAEQIEAEPDALAMIARAADGSMRDALSLADQALSLGERTLTAARVREALGLVAEEEYLSMLQLVAERRAGEVFPAVARLVDAGVDLGLFLSGLADVLRAELALGLGGEAPDVSERVREELARAKGRYTPGDLLRMLSAVSELEPRFRKSGQQQLLLETLLVRFALMDRTLVLEEVLRGLGGPSGGDDDREPPRRPPSPSPRDVPSAPVAPPPPSRTPARPEPPGDPRPSSPAQRAAPPPAGATPGRTAQEELSLNRLVERWGDVIERVRSDGRAVLAAALEHALPIGVTARGEITLEVEPAGAIYQQPIVGSAADVLSAVGTLFTGATRIQARVTEEPSGTTDSPRRLTEEGMRHERLAKLRQRDPVLDLAVQALDLELVD